MNEVVVYENDDWKVFADRMEHKEADYVVQTHPAEKRAESGLWDWPLHLAEKSWFHINTFAPAFLELLKARRVAVDASLLMTFHEIGRNDTKKRMFEQAAKDLDAYGPGGALDFRRMVDIDIEVQRRLGVEE